MEAIIGNKGMGTIVGNMEMGTIVMNKRMQMGLKEYNDGLNIWMDLLKKLGCFIIFQYICMPNTKLNGKFSLYFGQKTNLLEIIH